MLIGKTSLHGKHLPGKYFMTVKCMDTFFFFLFVFRGGNMPNRKYMHRACKIQHKNSWQYSFALTSCHKAQFLISLPLRQLLAAAAITFST